MAHYVLTDPDFLSPVGIYDTLDEAQGAALAWTWQSRPVVLLWEGDGYVAEWYLPDGSSALIENDLR